MVVAGVGWMVLVAVALAWLHAAATAGQQWDQMMADRLDDDRTEDQI